MNVRRSPNRTYYVYRECGNRINPAAYRAVCPTCGGALVATAAAAGRS
jgi:hypothetical protein